jgi:hypothetical protein
MVNDPHLSKYGDRGSRDAFSPRLYVFFFSFVLLDRIHADVETRRRDCLGIRVERRGYACSFRRNEQREVTMAERWDILWSDTSQARYMSPL